MVLLGVVRFKGLRKKSVLLAVARRLVHEIDANVKPFYENR